MTVSMSDWLPDRYVPTCNQFNVQRGEKEKNISCKYVYFIMSAFYSNSVPIKKYCFTNTTLFIYESITHRNIDKRTIANVRTDSNKTHKESRVAIYRRLIRSVTIQYHAIFYSCCCDIFEIRWRQFFCVNPLSKKCEGYTLEIKIREKCYLLQF